MKFHLTLDGLWLSIKIRTRTLILKAYPILKQVRKREKMSMMYFHLFWIHVCRWVNRRKQKQQKMVLLILLDLGKQVHMLRKSAVKWTWSCTFLLMQCIGLESHCMSWYNSYFTLTAQHHIFKKFKLSFKETVTDCQVTDLVSKELEVNNGTYVCSKIIAFV